MASVIMDLVERELIEAEAIKANGDWSARAADIHQRLFDLYQAIGAVHLDGDEDLKAPRPTNTKRPGR
ncbi:hypothetical protein E3C22_10535 [Jiella endophytica]|uniref:Uncharacterized protein n=1 Tax=Jiella endophytica TaxID=2558362 RepID=A0A4Y8RIL2_9HYPH|nr:hypothetical protein [Jiella endophytica]TFF22888.1 hypothetical protein E3C22_10535 [Jiella endophytica]